MYLAKVPLNCHHHLRKNSREQKKTRNMRRCHTSQLWEEGTISSSFLAVKISIATKWHLAWPCLPVLEVETSTTYPSTNKQTTNPSSVYIQKIKPMPKTPHIPIKYQLNAKIKTPIIINNNNNTWELKLNHFGTQISIFNRN